MSCFIVFDWNRRIYGVFTTQEKAVNTITKLEQENNSASGFEWIEVPFETSNDFGILLP